MTYSFPNLGQVCCFMSSSNCCFLTCTQVFQVASKVVWYSQIVTGVTYIWVVCDGQLSFLPGSVRLESLIGRGNTLRHLHEICTDARFSCLQYQEMHHNIFVKKITRLNKNCMLKIIANFVFLRFIWKIIFFYYFFLCASIKHWNYFFLCLTALLFNFSVNIEIIERIYYFAELWLNYI